MNLRSGSLFDGDDLPQPHSETHRELSSMHGVRVGRIVSSHHASPDGFWYDQDDAEWVAVVAGDAVIEFDDGSMHTMQAGDWIEIPPHARHRIARTGERTIWLAVYATLAGFAGAQPTLHVQIRP